MAIYEQLYADNYSESITIDNKHHNTYVSLLSNIIWTPEINCWRRD